jgi:hypothetical protein
MDYKITKVYDIYRAVLAAKGTTKLTTFCKTHDLNYTSVAVFLETMERIADELRESIVGARSGEQHGFMNEVVKKLGITIQPSDDKIEFPIPFSFARALAKLDKDEQVEFVKRWKNDAIDVNRRNIEEFVASASLDGFDMAYDYVYLKNERQFATEQCVLIMMAKDPVTIPDLVRIGFKQEDVEKALGLMCKSGLVRQHNGKFELTELFTKLYSKVWNSLPETALAAYTSKMLDAMGVLSLDADKQKMKRVLKYLTDQVNHFNETIDKPSAIAMIRAMPAPKHDDE